LNASPSFASRTAAASLHTALVPTSSTLTWTSRHMSGDPPDVGLRVALADCIGR
jgi:hypothetical protein